MNYTQSDINECFKICRLICIQHINGFERCKLVLSITTVGQEFELIIHAKEQVYSVSETSDYRIIQKLKTRFAYL
jgi:hypothetical protein